jgi:hypothetical protein
MRILLPLLILFASGSSTHAAGKWVIRDIFGRRINEHGLVVVDWEGQIANPAIKFLIAPPAFQRRSF